MADQGAMVFARRRSNWELPGLQVTEEGVYRDRRRFLAAMGLGGLAASTLAIGGRRFWERSVIREVTDMQRLRARRNPAYNDGGRPQTSAHEAARFVNFFEFGGDKRSVPANSFDFALDPYSVRVDGLVEQPGPWTLERIEALGSEERIYRHRCVEAWAMTVPWIGVPLASLVRAVGVRPEAKYVSFESFDPKTSAINAPDGFPFPYYECLRIDEAAHDLAFLATGLYGHRLTPQNGAPMRLVVPWKYGFKSAKSLVRIHFSAERKPCFWNEVAPAEYSWLANVDPSTPHPRWSQESERLIGSGDHVPTLPYNGYDIGSLYT